MTERLKAALEGNKDTPHLRLFFAICRDITDLTFHQNSVPAEELLDFVADYATAEYNSRLPEEERGAAW